MRALRLLPWHPLQKPIIGRFLIAAWLLGAAQGPRLARGEPLDEAEVVRRGLRRPEVEALREGRRREGEAGALGAQLWENPELGYDRQQLFDDAQGGGQDVVALSQRFDLSGARGHRAAAAMARQEAEQHLITSRCVERAAALRLRFYDVLYAQREVEVLGAWVQALEGALRIVALREGGGEASRYDRLRLESELSRARHQVAEAALGREVAWAHLEAWAGDLGPEDGPWPRVQGALLPDALGAGAPSALTATERAYEAEARAATDEAEAAARAGVPWLEVGAGYMRQGIGDLNIHGFALSVSLPLTLVDYGQAEAARADAARDVARAEAALLRAQRGPELEAAAFEDAQRRALAEQFAAQFAQADALVAIAEAGYAGDELRLSELLEAHRHRAALEVEHLGLQRRARLARLQLEALRREGGGCGD